MEGPIDQETGMVFDLVALDGMVEREVLERFDHTNLNLDVENFRSRVPTTENVCTEIFDLLKTKLDGGGPLSAARLRARAAGGDAIQTFSNMKARTTARIERTMEKARQ